MLTFGEKLAFIGVEVRIHTVHLRSFGRCEIVPTLHTNFNFVILERHERKALGPVFTEEERNEIIVRRRIDALGVILDFSRRDRRRGAGLVLLVENVVNTLNVQRIKASDFLSTNVQQEFGRLRGTRGEETIAIGQNIRNVFGFDPDVTEHVTLRAYRNSDFIVGTKRTDVIHAFRLNRKIGVTSIVLAEETHLRFASDVHILSALGDKINQGC